MKIIKRSNNRLRSTTGSVVDLPACRQNPVGGLLETINFIQLSLNDLMALAADKKSRSDFSNDEWDEFVDRLQEMLLVEYSVKKFLKSVSKKRQ